MRVILSPCPHVVSSVVHASSLSLNCVLKVRQEKMIDSVGLNGVYVCKKFRCEDTLGFTSFSGYVFVG